jgi:hypothetical protein
MSALQAKEMQNQCVGMASILRKAQRGEDIAQLAFSRDGDPQDANFLMGLSMVFRALGNLALGLQLQAKALEVQQLYHEAPPSGRTVTRLLAIMIPGDLMENTPVDFLLEDADVALDSLYVAAHLPFPAKLPDHDVLFIAISQGDANRPMLEMLSQFLKDTTHPVLNKPERIIALSRDSVSKLLKNAPGVAIPITIRAARTELQSADNASVAALFKSVGSPLTLRPVDSHGGKGLARLADLQAISDYLEAMPEHEFFVSHFVEYRSADGLYRKYRVVLIDGQAFACHMAISDDWVVHFINAGMYEDSGKRAEEERFMQDFDVDFGFRHKSSFDAIHQLTGLDYLVIDCAETSDGKLLIFEVDNASYVHAMDPVALFPYKRPQMRKVFDAFGRMLSSAQYHQDSESV